MCDYNIYSIRSYNNDKLVFYNYTKRKRIGDILSGLKTRYKRHLNNKDNWVNVFYILNQDNSYIKIEEHIVNSNDEIVKSRLCEIIANNNCINKMKIEYIENLCNKTEEPITEVKSPTIIDEPKTDITENENKTEEPITDITENENKNKIDEPKTEVIEEVKSPTIIEEYFNTEQTNTETKIVKYIKEDTADISNNQVELLNDTITEVKSPTNNVKVIKNLADVKCIDDRIYEPSITSSSRHSRPSFKQQLEQLKPKNNNYNNKTIKYNYSDVVKIMNSKKNTTLKNKYN
jgi:hypothetical protein